VSIVKGLKARGGVACYRELPSIPLSRKVGEYLLGAHTISSKKVQKPLICVMRCAPPRAILFSARRNVAMSVNWDMSAEGVRGAGWEREEPLAVMIRPLSKKTIMLLVPVLLLAVVTFSGCGNDRATPHFSEDIVKRLDSAIAFSMKYDDLPGVVVGVWVPGEGQYVVARGKANLKTGEQRDLEDPFRIASITKTFTATAVLQLVEEGKLSKSDTLSKWHPDYPNADQITVDDLLRMRSGIAEVYPRADISAEDMIKRSARRGGRFTTPGQRTVYTNVNYLLLGEIVEKVSGEDLGTYITQTILEPLGMENTIYPSNNDLPGDLHGYSRDVSTGELKDTTNLDPAPIGGGDDLGYLGPEEVGRSGVYRQTARTPNAQVASSNPTRRGVDRSGGVWRGHREDG
jgi:CubicO group peptidase (beta-lactamase class C family)